MKHIGTQSIETERLLLRRYEPRDAEAMFRNWTADPAASRFWTWEPHVDVEETRGLIKSMIAGYADSAYYNWLIAQKKSDEAIGYIYFQVKEGEEDTASVHFLLSPKLWNRGLMTEACRAALAYGFERAGFGRIVSWHHPDNPASGRVLAKAGLLRAGEEYRTYPECPRIEGRYQLYALTSEEYRSIK